jgi:large subunit ribosomal protein L3e
VGKKNGDHGAKTDFDPTTKPITPMGGFVGYGEVKEDYVIIKVCMHCFCCAKV